MKNAYSICPDSSLMKLSPELDVNPSRPYQKQIYIAEYEEITDMENKSVIKCNYKISLNPSE